MARPDEDTCALMRNYEPRDAHEHALLAQLSEFYSAHPSHERLRAIAQRVERSSERERQAMVRAVVEDLCPTPREPVACWGPIAVAFLCIFLCLGGPHILTIGVGAYA